jgi:HAD superfamily hydrolase (TIGR01509 family)
MKTILVDAVNTLVIKNKEGKYALYQELLDLLDSYPNKKIVLTNANNQQFFEYNIHTVPYKTFTMEHNPDKIDPLYYKAFLNQSGLLSDEVVYFEHNLEAVNSARSVGINTYHYDKETKDLLNLKKFIDNNI